MLTLARNINNQTTEQPNNRTTEQPSNQPTKQTSDINSEGAGHQPLTGCSGAQMGRLSNVGRRLLGAGNPVRAVRAPVRAPVRAARTRMDTEFGQFGQFGHPPHN